YESNRFVERLPDRARNGAGLPEYWLGLYDDVLILDQESREAWVPGTEIPGREVESRAKAERLEAAFKKVLMQPPVSPPSTLPIRVESLRFDLPRREYLRAVRRAIDYIGDGEIFQVNLSQRLTAKLVGNSGS